MLMTLPTRATDADDAGRGGAEEALRWQLLLIMVLPTKPADADDAGCVGLNKP